MRLFLFPLILMLLFFFLVVVVVGHMSSGEPPIIRAEVRLRRRDSAQSTSSTGTPRWSLALGQLAVLAGIVLMNQWPLQVPKLEVPT